MKILEKIIEYGIYLFVFLLPWQTRLILREGNLNGYWEYGTFSIYGTEILLWAIFLLTAIWWTVGKLKVKSEKLEVIPILSRTLDKVGAVESSKLETNTKYKILNSPPEADAPRAQKFVSQFLSFSVFWFLGFFVFWSAISIFWSDSRSVALQAWLRLAEGIGLFLVLRVAKFDIMKLAWAFVVSAVIQAGLGAWQFLTQTTFASKWLGMAFHDPAVAGTFVVETALRRWLRAYGSLPHPNMLAGFLAVAMLLSIWLYQKLGIGFKKLLLPVCFVILTLGILTTFSKSAILALGAAAIFWWAAAWIASRRIFASPFLFKEGIKGWFWKHAPPPAPPQRGGEGGKTPLYSPSPPPSPHWGEGAIKFTLIFLAVAAIFSAIFWEPVSTRLRGQDRLEIKSTEQRLSYFGESWQLIKKHPLLGVGIGNYTLAVHDEINSNLQPWDYQPVHNIYLLILVELGIIGFLIFSIFILYTLYFILNIFRSGGNARNIIFALTFFMLLMIGFFDHYLWSLYFGVMLFWLSIGLTQKLLLDTPLDRL